jgi:hypothetical protein
MLMQWAFGIMGVVVTSAFAYQGGTFTLRPALAGVFVVSFVTVLNIINNRRTQNRESKEL